MEGFQFYSVAVCVALIAGAGALSLPAHGTEKVTLKPLVIEVLAIADYSEYTHFLNKNNGNKEEALKDLRFSVAHIFNHVNKIFSSLNSTKYTFNVKLTNFLVKQNPKDSQFTENPQFLDVEGAVIMSKALPYLQISVYPEIKNYDIVMAFTRAKLKDRGNAYLKSACKKHGISIVQHSEFMMTARATAHEIVHMLGAKHDEEDNDCRLEDKYLMSEHAPSLKHNFDIISRCSRDSVENYISELEQSRNCLETDDVFPPQIDLSEELLLPYGARMDVKDQCSEWMEEKNSSFCPGFGSKIGDDMCAGMSCFKPSIGRCVSYPGMAPFDGTTCGNRMWCMQGKCVPSDKAPLAEDGCWFKDAPQTFSAENYKKVNCSDVPTNPSMCTNKRIQQLCCASCKAVKF